MAQKDIKKILEDSKADLPSNEDVIESLVKGIQNSSVEDGCEPSENTPVHSTSTLNDKESSQQKFNECVNSDSDKCKELYDDEVEEEDVESKNTGSNEDDYIDEEHLKDLEVSYSEDDKKVLLFLKLGKFYLHFQKLLFYMNNRMLDFIRF